MKISLSIYCLVAMAGVTGVFAQTTDTVKLPVVSFVDLRTRAASQSSNEVLTDSATRSDFLTSSVAQLLLQQNTAFVKAYGPANIASLTLRGSTAQQVAVVWNGMNINNPMLGQTDVSLLPAGFFDAVTLQRGGLSGYWGSGAMAGALNLLSGQPAEGLTLKAGSAYSSFQNFSQWISADLGRGRWSSSTKLFADLAANRYTFYRHPDSLAESTQEHAQSKQYALLQDIGYRINSKQHLGLHLWAQDAQRQVPYTLQELRQDASQHDRIFRGMLNWSLSKERYSLTARAALCKEDLFYENKTYAITSDNSFKTWLLDLEGQFSLGKGFTLTAGSTNAISLGKSPGYEKERALSRMALYENLAWRYRKLRADLCARQEVFNTSIWVPTGGLTISVQALSWLSCRANLATIYRYPTLNDLYWSPGGDPDLKPEEGYSVEGSLVIEKRVGRFKFSGTGTLFSRKVDNWLMWLPGRNGVWSPRNVPSVWSRGGETNSALVFTGNKFRFSLNLVTNYVLSTRETTVLENDGSVGRQLPYVPMYSGSAKIKLEYRGFALQSGYVYTGYRYLSSDNYYYLEPYELVDARVGYTFILKKWLLHAFAECNNLLNGNYYSVAQYPMPLRNFRTGISIQYHKNKKQ